MRAFNKLKNTTMLKMKLNIKALLLCAGLLAGTTAFAQEPAKLQVEETQDSNVSDAELEKFARVIKTLQSAEQESQKKMIAIVEQEDLDIEKFKEIHQANIQNLEVKASEAEQQKYQRAVTKLEAMQPEILQLMESIISTEGLTMERFQQIAAAMQSNPGLQLKLQKLMIE